MTGTKGGRIVRYFTGNDAPTQAVTMVDTTALYLTNANHTNEEVARTYNWREFGAGRTDDFSLASGTPGLPKAFTLDDGTTTLTCSDVAIYSECIIPGGASLNAFTTLTFIGTGLDLTMGPGIGPTTDTIGVFIDGASIGNLPTSSNTNRQLKIASGLAYGTHTAKFVRSVFSVGAPTVKQFIVYQPRKPVLPVGAIELADYNVMATYARSSTVGVASADPLSTGILFKSGYREHVYKGTWTGANVAAGSLGGTYILTAISTDYVEYTFFGTGIEFHTSFSGSIFTATVLLDGSAYSGSATVAYNGGIVPTWVGGVFTGGGANGATLQISSLTLGVHTVRLIKSTPTDSLYFTGVSVITPIHSHKSNLYADLQNTLPVGSQGLMDSRSVSPQPLALNQTKAWAQAVGIAAVTTSATTPVPLPDMSVTIKTNGGSLYISYTASVCTDVVGGQVPISIYVNGVATGFQKNMRTNVASYSMPTSDQAIIPVSVGTHKVDLYWFYATAGTAATASQLRNLTVREL